jgi:zinc transporter, ZIP family
VIGSIVAIFVSLPKSIIAAIMAFGSGVLVAALTFSLVEEAFSLSQSIPPVVIGFVLGGVSYSIANYILDRKDLTEIMLVVANLHLDYHCLLGQ